MKRTHAFFYDDAPVTQRHVDHHFHTNFTGMASLTVGGDDLAAPVIERTVRMDVTGYTQLALLEFDTRQDPIETIKMADVTEAVEG